MLKSLTTLALIGSICGVLLVGADEFTQDEIRANRMAKTRAILQELGGTEVQTNDALSRPLFGDCASGVFVRATAAGYAGPIETIGLWRPARRTLSVRVTRHRETPGIGTFIDGDWLRDRDDTSQNQWLAVDAVAGATITSNAIQNAIQASFARVETEFCE